MRVTLTRGLWSSYLVAFLFAFCACSSESNRVESGDDDLGDDTGSRQEVSTVDVPDAAEPDVPPVDSGDAAVDPESPDDREEDESEPPASFTMEGRHFELRPINSIGGAPIYPDIATGPSDQPVVVFRKGERVAGAMEYWPAVSMFDGDSWSAPEEVERQSGAYLGKRPSIVSTPDRRLHVIAYDEDNERPRWAVRVANTWEVNPIYRDDVDSGDHSNLSLDGQGRPVLSMLQYTDYRLVVGVLDGDQWRFEVVEDDQGPVRASSSSMAIGPDDSLHIAYYTGNHLHYAHSEGEGWRVEVVDNSVDDVGHYPNMALDHTGQPCVVYLRWPDEVSEVRVACRQTDGSWQVEVVAAGLGIAYTTGIATASDGTLLVAYPSNIDESTHALNLAYRNPDGGHWQTHVVDDSSYISGIDMVVSAAGTIHIAYFDESDYVLRHAELVDSP